MSLTAGRTREETVRNLLDCPAGAVIGLDFAFSFPAWWVASFADVDEVWAAVARSGETWLAACEPPFWGRPGRPRPLVPGAVLRRTELAHPGTRSVFQIGGAGSVGTGSLRGMPLLRDLRRAGMAIWPFDDWATDGRPVVAEVWPRSHVGSVVKTSLPARRAHLAALIQDPLLEVAAGSDDAFDAACAALSLSQSVPPTVSVDAIDRVEGRILD